MQPWYYGCMKVMTIRQRDDQAAELELVARVDDMSIAKAIDAAIDAYIAARRTDPEFQDRLRQRVEAEQGVVRRLTEGKQ